VNTYETSKTVKPNGGYQEKNPLKKFRLSNNLSQKDVVDRLHVAKGSIFHWGKYKTGIPKSKLRDWQKNYDLSSDKPIEVTLFQCQAFKKIVIGKEGINQRRQSFKI